MLCIMLCSLPDGKTAETTEKLEDSSVFRDRDAPWWAGQDSNLQPDRYERPALTIELPALRGAPTAH
jgi:hypothetical protein